MVGVPQPCGAVFASGGEQLAAEMEGDPMDDGRVLQENRRLLAAWEIRRWTAAWCQLVPLAAFRQADL
jgi:hypothetical protein